jgi:lactoylglutathione lyase
MKYLHTMVRARDLDESLDFYCDKLGLVQVNRYDSDAGRFSLVFLAAPDDVAAAEKGQSPLLEITWNWDPQDYDDGRNFGHLAYRVQNIYQLCQTLMDKGVTINRPPRDGHMAFIRSPDGISIELLQAGEALAQQEPWASMENTGSW